MIRADPWDMIRADPWDMIRADPWDMIITTIKHYYSTEH